MEIFKLFGSILVDSNEADKSISSTGEKAEGLGQKLKNGMATAAKWGAAIATAAVAAGTALVAAAKGTAEDLDVIDKASQRMKVTAEQYQELAYAAGMSGVEMSVMEKAAKKLEGTDLNMQDAIDQIMALGSEEERSAKAAELFGNAVAYQMTPLLNVGADGMQQLKDDAHNLGLVFSNETVTAGATMGDMFSNVEQSIATLKNGLVADLMPYVMEILQWIIDNIPLIKKTIKTVIDWIAPYIKPVLEGVVKIVSGIFKLINGDTEGFKQDIISALKGLGTALFNIGKDVFTSLWNGIKDVWGSIKGWVDDKVSWMKDKLAFWKKSNDSMKTDGSHASGLNYVPYDGYVAELHRGEMVLNAGNTQNLRDDIVNGIKSALGSGIGGGTIIVQSVLDGKVIGESAYNYANNKRMRYGL